ncbi:glycosyltransferase family 2 protein [Candidatus Pelagibacter communis]|uniref:glycosyltransferase family 2 protein n=1 Tax=Pelagibacter ubique TaxID=198252 RepID=UPI00094D4D8E|nr:glycosyltransferase family 2 protein [Candidatus Pelagibacter ubique]|tara:strand:+ start:367 stop:1122 length:756 start_codon:yes stop_codon:yes gene_type:complete
MRSVSIIIPYFKKQKYFDKTINSVLKQTYKKKEIIIVYDDEDLTELKKLKKKLSIFKNIKIILNRKNLGAGLSRNKGIKKSKGKYIAFIDADDLWNKKKLEKQINFMKKNNLEFSHTSYSIINKNDKLIGEFRVKENLTYSDLLNSCDIGLSTVIIKRSLILKNKFNNFKTKEDYSLWLKLSKKGVIIKGFNQKLTKWRQLNNSLSSSFFQKILDGFNVYYLSERKKIITSLICLLNLSFNAIRKKVKIYK